ncbi:MAG: class II aldolase/adducin family protein [Candidatus Sumerlaeota bacterium]
MDLFEKYSKEVETFLKVCHRLAANLYVTSHGGNLAWKLEADLILITPTQMNKGEIGFKDVVFINMAGDTVAGERKPTGEKPMYLKFFAERPDIVSVLHCHPPYTCAFAIMEDPSPLMRPFYPEAVTEVGPVPLVPYAEPLTDELARNFSDYLQKYNSFLMENHGLVTMSRGDIEWTLLNVELLEGSSQSIAVAMAAGKLKELDREAVAGLSNVMETRDLPLFGAPGAHKNLLEMYFPNEE